MARQLKFRAWNGRAMEYGGFDIHATGKVTPFHPLTDVIESSPIMQFTGLHDKNGGEIWEGDILHFADKWEWYRGEYATKMHFATEGEHALLLEQYNDEPEEYREIKIPEDYEWLLSSEIQQWWVVIGSIHENPELLEAE